jgi:hypothetical protein
MTANGANSYYGDNECRIGCETVDIYDVNNNNNTVE